MVSSLSVPRDAVGVCLLGDRLYAVGGYDGQSYLNSVESYDAQNNEWTEVFLMIQCFIVHFVTFCSICGLLKLKKNVFYEACWYHTILILFINEAYLI